MTIEQDEEIKRRKKEKIRKRRKPNIVGRK